MITAQDSISHCMNADLSCAAANFLSSSRVVRAMRIDSRACCSAVTASFSLAAFMVMSTSSFSGVFNHGIANLCHSPAPIRFAVNAVCPACLFSRCQTKKGITIHSGPSRINSQDHIEDAHCLVVSKSGTGFNLEGTPKELRNPIPNLEVT